MATNEEMQNFENGMREAMGLETSGEYFEDNLEAPIAVPDSSGRMIEMDPSALAAEGMGFSQRYMASNGPTQPNRISKATTMTRAQLEEQKMNEREGYPSNLDEAQKVKDLGIKVQNIETGISQILSHLGANQSSASRNVAQSSPPNLPQSGPTGGNPASPAASPTLTPAPSAIVPLPNPPSTVSGESTELENKQLPLRQVTLKDGRKISVPQASPPAMSLGPATETVEPPTQVEEDKLRPGDNDGWGDNPIAVVPQPEPEAEEPKVDPKLAQTQQLVQDVNDFMRANDVHRFWRRHLAQNVHRHVGYNGWPKKLQAEFDVRFKGFLSDPQFVTSVCRKIISMELGHVLGAKQITSFLVATAGFTAFALIGLDG